MDMLNVDQRVKLMIGEMIVRNICLEKEIEDLRAKLEENHVFNEKPVNIP